MGVPSSGAWLSGRIAAGLLALLCGAVLFARVYVDFDTVRLKVVRTAIASRDGEVSVSVPPASSLAALQAPAPVVLIATVRNGGAAPAVLTLRVDGAAVRTLTVAPDERTRFDLVLPPAIAVNPGSIIGLRGQGDAWSLEYLELGNLHGSSGGAFRFIIVPASPDAYQRPPPWMAVLVSGIVFLLLRLDTKPPRRAWVVMLRRVLTALVALVMTIVLLSSVVTPFKLLLAPRGFVSLVVLLMLGSGLWQACVGARARMAAAFPRGVRAADCAAVALAVAAFYTCLMFAFLAPHEGNYSGLLLLGRPFVDRMPALEERPALKTTLAIFEGGGYDAQFAYAMTFDPFLSAHADPARYRDVVDTPPYRYGRIGFSLLTKIASGDQPERYPVTMVWLVIAGLFTGALCLAAVCLHHGQSPAWGLLYVLVPGFVQSVHVTLPEPIAGALLLAGYWCWLRSYLWPAAACLAASLLVRETGAILVVALVAWELIARRPRAAATLASAGLVYALWRAYVGWRLFPAWGWQGLFFNPGNLGAPFTGVLELWQTIGRGLYYPNEPQLALAGAWYPLVLFGVMGLAGLLLWKRRTPITIALAGFAALAAVMDYPSIWLHAANAERTSYECILFSIVALASLDAPGTALRRARMGFFGILALYLLFASVDAPWVRAVLSAPFV
jgi:hypothetical protein